MEMIPDNASTLRPPPDGGTPSPPAEYESDPAAALQDVLVYSALAVSCILGIPGNLMILVRLSCRLRHSNLTRRLFFSLALADLLFLLGLPLAVAMRNHVLVLTDELCQLQAYFSFYFLASGFSIVVLMSIQRYFKVLHPQKWSVLGQRGEQMLLLVPWFVGFVAALPVAFLMELEEGLGLHACSSHFDTSLFLQVVYTSVRAFGYLVLLVFYIQLIRGVKRAVLFNPPRMFKLIVLLIVTALVCGMPGVLVHVVTVIATLAGSQPTLEVLHELEVVEYLYFFNSSLHPFFYFFASGRRKGGWARSERTETNNPTM